MNGMPLDLARDLFKHASKEAENDDPEVHFRWISLQTSLLECFPTLEEGL